ncbi:MAG: 30S ribosomal protein S21 [Anaerolineales bacterium]|nr:30S ribosomal protein S21 [Anaerolineales bacterium]
MIIINVKEDESIERALKRYNRKHRAVGIIKQLREKRNFVKKSEARRNQIMKAKYRLDKYGNS